MNLAFALQQLRRNLAALGMRRLAMLAVAGSVIFAAIAIGSYWIARSDYQLLYVGLAANDASRIAAVLTELGIPFETSTDGTKVSVPSSAVARTRGVLAERGLPASAGAGYELFDKIGPLGLTTFMQEVSRVRALEGEIMRTLNSMSGIVSSRVHLVMSDKTSLRQPAYAPTASVVLKLGVPVDRAPVDAVRNIVAAAVPALATQNVRVVSSDGTVLASGGENTRTSPDKVLGLESAFALQLKQNLSETLTPLLGLENFQSSVSVRLNADQSTVNESTFDPASKVERSTRVVKESGSAKDGAADPAVSVDQNIPGATDTAQSRQSQKANQRRDETTNYEISSKTIQTTRDGYRIDRISLAIVVNKASLKKPDGTALEEAETSARLSELEKIAASAVGLDSQRGDRITVVAQSFQADAAVLSDDESQGFGAALGNTASTLVTAATLVLSVLAILWFGARPLVRILIEQPQVATAPALSAPVAEASAATATIGRSEARPAMSQQSGPRLELSHNPHPRHQGGMAPLIAQLNDLVSQDPEQAVAVVRRWIKAESA